MESKSVGNSPRYTAGSIALVVMTVSAIAQVSSNWQACTGNPGVDWDQQIKSCTALIESEKEPKENVAIAFYNRALAYENKENYRALSPTTARPSLNPNDAMLYCTGVSTSKDWETRPVGKPT